MAIEDIVYNWERDVPVVVFHAVKIEFDSPFKRSTLTLESPNKCVLHMLSLEELLAVQKHVFNAVLQRMDEMRLEQKVQKSV